MDPLGPLFAIAPLLLAARLFAQSTTDERRVHEAFGLIQAAAYDRAVPITRAVDADDSNECLALYRRARTD